MITLVLGGARSGKSSLAETLALQRCPDKQARYYLACGEAIDEEMCCRIKRHRRNRGDNFRTIEEPVQLAAAITEQAASAKIVMIDCLTTWLGNLTYHYEEAGDYPRSLPEGADRENCCEQFPPVAQFMEFLRHTHGDIIMVSNELGQGLVPVEATARLFRDRQGRLNQEIAALADQVIFVVAGCPIVMKGPAL